MKIYAASSWRNNLQPSVVQRLRDHGHVVYDFKNPGLNRKGFAWSEIDPKWEGWDIGSFRRLLSHPVAEEGFRSDWNAMVDADAGVLIMPCGRSAHIEAGYFVGAKKPLFILLAEAEPELMYKMATGIATSLDSLIEMIDAVVKSKEIF